MECRIGCTLHHKFDTEECLKLKSEGVSGFLLLNKSMLNVELTPIFQLLSVFPFSKVNVRSVHELVSLPLSTIKWY